MTYLAGLEQEKRMRLARWLSTSLVLALMVLLGWPGYGAGDDTQQWTRFATVDGLPSDTIWAIAASPDGGDIWLGTSNGASLFRDGRWYSYTQEQGLGANWVTALAVDPANRVWFGTFGGGLTVLDPTQPASPGSDQWQTYTAANSGLPGDWISALAIDDQGRVICGTWGRGVGVFDGQTWQTYATDNSPLPDDYVTAVATGSNGGVWIGLHGHGLAHLQGSQWTLYDSKAGLPDDFVSALAVGADGSLWVGTDEGLSQLDSDGRVSHTYNKANGLPDDRIEALAVGPDGRLWVGTANGAAVLENGRWTVYQGADTLAHNYVSALAATSSGVWFGSVTAGVAHYGVSAVASTRRLPVVLVHGWHGPDSDLLEDSEYRFMASWLREDGFPVYYAQGISPKNTLDQNAAQLKAVIQRAKKETGAAQVDIIAFSMGGLNARAYMESGLYAGDVDQAFILGTPEVGVHEWYPFLMRELHEWSKDPSAVELTPDYANLFNALHANPGIPYTLIAGDAHQPELPETLRDLPPGDALIMAGEALALDGPNVRKILTNDLHAFSDQTILLGLPSYLWPRDTYDAYIRNGLRLGPGVPLPGEQEETPPAIPVPSAPIHSPFYDGQVSPGQSMTQTVQIDTAGDVHFYLRSQNGGDALSFSLIDPSGARIDAKTIGQRGEFFDLGLADLQSYLVHNAQPGAWKVVVGRAADAQGPLRFTGYATFNTPIRLTVASDKPWYGKDEQAVVTATLTTNGAPLPGAQVTAEIGRPDGQIDKLSLADDGQHGDGAAGDGVYGARYRPPNLGGWYTLFVTARGTGYAQTSEKLLAFSSDSASLSGNYTEAATDANRDGKYETLDVSVGVDVRAAGNYLVAGSLVDSRGKEVARVAQPVSLNSGPQAVTLSFPGHALIQAQSDGPYTVSHVMILDEAGAALPLQEAVNVLQTRPYRYQDFEGP